MASLPSSSRSSKPTELLLGNGRAVIPRRSVPTTLPEDEPLTETLLCFHLSAILLVGLLLDATVGWAVGRTTSAIEIPYLALREGVEAWRGGERDHHGEG
jgi:hypothetical protein